MAGMSPRELSTRMLALRDALATLAPDLDVAAMVTEQPGLVLYDGDADDVARETSRVWDGSSARWGRGRTPPSSARGSRGDLAAACERVPVRVRHRPQAMLGARGLHARGGRQSAREATRGVDIQRQADRQLVWRLWRVRGERVGVFENDGGVRDEIRGGDEPRELSQAERVHQQEQAAQATDEPRASARRDAAEAELKRRHEIRTCSNVSTSRDTALGAVPELSSLSSNELNEYRTMTIDL